ncbi:biopolymer transport membrane protein, TolR-related [Geotalea daltonii FRC-32]|uniref:Biopolymer transport membrane protein, TolR-related n=1 Tax=Geotalea daltonii (strain DSM 22248 / JCM 15807 / FRC-32) TaxID=316067 RepID=B9M351_GEODF|nr:MULTISPECIES: protein TolR [Geotalea]ACM19461.1 biopolymer transport membrane protein, TolR-related [Geotalea daltonii FRC-32]
MELGSRDNNGRSTMSQINVTPLVDVMLVLLVIFMVTAPMMQQGVQVNLPKADTKALAPQEETVIVTLERSGSIFINKAEVPQGELKTRLAGMFASRAKKEVFLKADKDVPYGEVVKTMAEIKGAGIERLGMVTEPAQGK